MPVVSAFIAAAIPPFIAAAHLDLLVGSAGQIYFSTSGVISMATIRVVPLGAGQDVGRSCVLVSIGGKNVRIARLQPRDPSHPYLICRLCLTVGCTWDITTHVVSQTLVLCQSLGRSHSLSAQLLSLICEPCSSPRSCVLVHTALYYVYLDPSFVIDFQYGPLVILITVEHWPTSPRCVATMARYTCRYLFFFDFAVSIIFMIFILLQSLTT